jgi:hypothetical protein
VQPQRVTDVVQTDGVGQLRKEHADHVTPGTKGSRHGIHAGLPRKLRHQMRRNQIAKLPENSEFGCAWSGVSFDHLCRVTKLKSHANHFFSFVTEVPVGWLCLESELPNPWRHKCHEQPGDDSHSAANRKVILEAIPPRTHHQHCGFVGNRRAERG